MNLARERRKDLELLLEDIVRASNCKRGSSAKSRKKQPGRGV